MAIKTSIEKAFTDKRFKIFFSLVIAFVLAAAVTIDQQSKNLIKLLVVTGIIVTIFNWREIKRHLLEFNKISVLALSLYYFSILLSIGLNPINENTAHDARIMSIGFTSIFIWGLMISIRFRADYFWWGIVLCAISSGVYALIETGIYGIDHRAAGSSKKWVMFGDIALISGLISIAAINQFSNKTSFLKLIPHIAAVMGLIASILSGTRGGWIFLPLAGVIIGIHLFKKNQIGWQFSLKHFSLTLALLFIAVFLLFNHTRFPDRINIAYNEIHGYFTDKSEATGRTSIGQRFEMWKATIIAFNDAPFFGIGPGAFDNHLARLAKANKVNRQVAEAFQKGQKQYPHTHAHNEFLNTLVTRGLFGLGTVLLLFIYLLVKFIRLIKSDSPLKSDFGLAGILLVTGYFVFALSESVLYHAMTANFFFVTLVSLLYLSTKQQDSTSTSA